MLRRTFLALVMAFGMWSIPAANAANPVKFGIVGPMTFVQGEDMWTGAQIARDEINAAGGIKIGKEMRPVEIVKVDTNELRSPADAANAVERAITRDRVDFLVGGFRTEAVLPMRDIAMDYKKIFLGIGASTDMLGDAVEKDYDRYKYWFRAGPTKSSDLAKTLFIILGSVADQIRTDLGQPQPKVAILAEKAQWNEAIIKAAEANLPKMKMEIVGTWRPSPIAADVTGELSAIRRANADIIFTLLSGPVGVVMGRQMGELQIPAVAYGINVEAQHEGFWEATGGKGEYVATLDTFGENVAVTPKTIEFVKKFRERAGRAPTQQGAVYDAMFVIKEAVETAGTLNSDKLVPVLEKTDHIGVASRLVFDKRHDEVFGPGYATGVGSQWQNGRKVGFWPKNWQGTSYPGIESFKVPPQMVAKKKNDSGAAGSTGQTEGSKEGSK